MHEAVTIIKGVLGFDEQPLSDPPRLRRMPASEVDSRMRAGSDPFDDAKNSQPRKSSGRGPAPPPPPSRRQRTQPGEPQQSARAVAEREAAVPLLAPMSSPISPMTPTSGHVPSSLSLPLRSSPTPSDDDDEIDDAEEEADLNKARFRIWIFPAHITDQEAEFLMSFFPRYVRTSDPRFPISRRGAKDLELGSEPWHTVTVEGVPVTIPKVEAEDEAGVVRSGTGRLWIGSEERDAGWMGSRWFRFKRWWRRLFGRG